jgi:HSP20 family protein
MASLIRWQPFQELTTLREAMDRLFEESFIRPWEGWPASAGEGALAVDIYETPKDVVVQTVLPGIDPKDVDVSVVGDTLTIKGESKAEEQRKEVNYIRRECRYGAFSRSLPLPTNVEPDRATADYANGVLTLRLPKAEEVKPKRIEIKAR